MPAAVGAGRTGIYSAGAARGTKLANSAALMRTEMLIAWLMRQRDAFLYRAIQGGDSGEYACTNTGQDHCETWSED
jgi:hypothetical protein